MPKHLATIYPPGTVRRDSVVKFWLLLLLTSAALIWACGDVDPTVTADPVASATLAPTPRGSDLEYEGVAVTSTSTAASAPTPTPPFPDDEPEGFENWLEWEYVQYTVNKASNSLRAAPSFHLSVLREDHVAQTRLEIDIVAPNRTRILMNYPIDGENFEAEYIKVDGSDFVLYPGFRGWFSVGESYFVREGYLWDPVWLTSFPVYLTPLGDTTYLEDLLDIAKELGPVRETVIDGERAYRLVGTLGWGHAFNSYDGIGGNRLAWDILDGRDGVIPDGRGAVMVDLWMRYEDHLPIRMEFQVELTPAVLEFVYSDYGADVEISMPEEALDIIYIVRLIQGDLGPEGTGALIRIIPVQGQQCMEAETGTDIYQEGMAWDSDVDFLVMRAFVTCFDKIFTGDSGEFVNNMTYYWLSGLHGYQRDIDDQVLWCLWETIGAEALFEIAQGEREPTFQELQAKEPCRKLAGVE